MIPDESELIEMDLDRVHDELDRLNAPEPRATLCASDRLMMVGLRLNELANAARNVIRAANAELEGEVEDSLSWAEAMSELARLVDIHDGLED